MYVCPSGLLSGSLLYWFVTPFSILWSCFHCQIFHLSLSAFKDTRRYRESAHGLGTPLFSGRLHSSLCVPFSNTLASHVQRVRLQNLQGPELYLPPGICGFKHRKGQEIQLRAPEDCPWNWIALWAKAQWDQDTPFWRERLILCLQLLFFFFFFFSPCVKYYVIQTKRLQCYLFLVSYMQLQSRTVWRQWAIPLRELRWTLWDPGWHDCAVLFLGKHLSFAL